MQLKGGLTIYGMTWDSILAMRVHRTLKQRGYINIKVWVVNGKWTAMADLPGKASSENYKIKDQKSIWN